MDIRNLRAAVNEHCGLGSSNHLRAAAQNRRAHGAMGEGIAVDSAGNIFTTVTKYVKDQWT